MNGMSYSSGIPNFIELDKSIEPAPRDGIYYLHAESTARRTCPFQICYTLKKNIVDVGELIRIEQGRSEDGYWRTYTFKNLSGEIKEVKDNHEGRTHFIFTERIKLKLLAIELLSEMKHSRNEGLLIEESKDLKEKVFGHHPLLNSIALYL